MNASALVDAFAAARPQALQLAELVSFAVLVDRPLLRQARTRLVPHADAGAEADLWLSPLVKSHSSEGFTFVPEVASVLRHRLASDAKRTEEAWKLTTEMHEHLPPTLKLEETINHLSVDESEAAAREIDALLSSVLAAMAAGGRDGLASWAARALSSFPTSVRKRSTALMLAAGTSLRLGTDPRGAFGKDIPEWLRFVAPAQLPIETIGVQLAPGMLRVDATKNPTGQLLRLPATRPYLIDVWWNASDGKEEGLQIALRSGDTQNVAVGAGEVRLRTVAGDTFELRLGGTAQSDVWQYIIDFSEVLERAVHGNANVAGSILNEGAPMTLITGTPGSGKTSTLAQIVQQASSSGAACAYHFFESGTPRLEYWDFAERSLIAQLMRRYAAPSWAVTMRLREFLDMIAEQVDTGPVYLVLDNVDVVQKAYTVSDVLGPLMQLPPQFVVVASATPSDRLETDTEAVRRVQLPSTTPSTPELPRGGAALLYLQALAVARAPLPVSDAHRVRAAVKLSPPHVTPWTVQRVHLDEPSIALENEHYRALVHATIGATKEHSPHSIVAEALRTGLAEQTWYGIRHRAFHELLAGEGSAAAAILGAPAWLERSIERFGAAITVDIIEECAMALSPDIEFDPAPLDLVLNALRNNLQLANENPKNIGPLLYAALRRDSQSDDEMDDLLGLTPTDLPLRIASYTDPKSDPQRLRIPGPVAAIHVAERGGNTIIRCTNALLFRDESERAKIVFTPRLTASALDGDSVITGDAEGTVTFWNAPGGEIAVRFAAHRAEVTQVLITDDGAYSCAADGTIVRWERMPAWRIETRFDAPAGISASAAAGNLLVVGCRNGDLLEISRLPTVVHPRAHDGAVSGVLILRGEQVIVSSGADRKLRACLRHVPASGTSIVTGHTVGISGLVQSGRPDLFATFAADRSARLWTLALESLTIEPAGVLDQHDAAVTTACFLRGRREHLVTGCADGSVKMWNSRGQLLGQSHRHEGAVRACVFGDDSVITGSDDARIEGYRVKNDQLVPTIDDAGVTECVSVDNAIAYCRDGSWDVRSAGGMNGSGGGESTSLALRDDGRRVLVWNLGAKDVSEWDIQSSVQAPLTTMHAPIVRCAFVGKTAVVATESGDLTFMTTDTMTKPHTGPITALATTALDAFTGGVDGAVVHTRIRGGKPEVFAKIGSHSSPVSTLATGVEVVASGSRTGEVAVWRGDGRDGSQIPIFRTHLDARISHLAFPAYRDTLVVASDDHLATIWNYRSGARIATCAGHRDRITALVIDDRSQLIYTASLDRTVRAWNFKGEQRGIVYGDAPFSAMCLIHGNIMEGEVLVGDDAGALMTLSYRGDELEADDAPSFKARFPPTPVRTISAKKKAPKKKKSASSKGSSKKKK